MKCKRCGTYFDYEKTYGICPKCVAYNRPENKEKKEEYNEWSDTEYQLPLLSGNIEEKHEKQSAENINIKVHKKPDLSKNGKKNDHAGKKHSQKSVQKRLKIQNKEKKPGKQRKIFVSIGFLILLVLVLNAWSSYRKFSIRTEVMNDFWENDSGEVNFDEKDIFNTQPEKTWTETEKFQPNGQPVGFTSNGLNLLFYEPEIYDTSEVHKALGDDYVFITYPIERKITDEQEIDSLQVEVYLKNEGFYYSAVYPFQLEDSGIHIPWCDTAQSLVYEEKMVLCFAVKKDTAKESSLFIQFQKPAKEEGYYQTTSQYTVNFGDEISCVPNQPGTSGETLQCKDPVLTFMKKGEKSDSYLLTQEFTAPWNRIVYLMEMLPYAEDSDGIGKVEIQVPKLDYEDEYYLEKLPVLPCGVTTIMESEVEVSSGVKQITLYLSGTEEEYEWEIMLSQD